MNITEGNTREMKQAIAFYGPVSILINTQPKSFKFYGSGIYYDQECSKYDTLHFVAHSLVNEILFRSKAAA